MANFRTHLTVGTVAASAAAFASFGQGLSDPAETQALFAVAVAASLLPDIDADDSRPIRAVFDLAGIVCGFLAAFYFAGQLRVVELLLIWTVVWFVVRWPLRWTFARFTAHRGVWHSLLMAVTISLAATVTSARWLEVSPQMAWLVGGFALIGYVTHLVLDEFASVDLFDHRVKRSFGTALKPLSLRAWPASLALAGVLWGLWSIAPDPAPLIAAMSSWGLTDLSLSALWPCP